MSSTPESEWDDHEQGWMLALRAYRDSLCARCSGDLAVTTAPENEGLFKAKLPVQCFRCVAFAEVHDTYKDEHHPQTLIHLVPREPARR